MRSTILVTDCKEIGTVLIIMLIEFNLLIGCCYHYDYESGRIPFLHVYLYLQRPYVFQPSGQLDVLGPCDM